MADGFFANDPAAYLRELQMRLNGSPNNVGAAPGPGFLDQMQRALPVQPATPPTYQTPATPPALGTMFAGNERPDMGAAAGGQLGMPPQAPAAQPRMPGGGFLDGLHNFVLQNRGALAGMGAAIQSGRPVGYGALQGAEIDQKRKDDEQQKQREKSFADATGSFLKDNPFFAQMLKADPSKAGLILGLAQQERERNSLTAYQKAQLDLENKKLSQAGDSTADVKNYQVYARETAAAGQKPMSFLEYQTTLKSAGRQNNTITMSGETEFEKGMGKAASEMFTGMMKDGIDAKSDLGLVDRLEQNLQGQPGGVVGAMQGIASDYGINVGLNTDKLQVAKSIIAKLVPSQRVPGSGTTSDRDLALFQQAVPKLSNTPEGNALIIQTMRGLAQYKQQQGQIATAVATGKMTRQQGMEALAQLPDPLSQFKAATSGETAVGVPDADGWIKLPNGARIKEVK